MVREAWSPIMRKYADTAELDAVAFMREYGRHTTYLEMKVTELTRAVLSDRFKKVSKDTATGVDGWAVHDLVHMQPRLWSLLAELLCLVAEVWV